MRSNNGCIYFTRGNMFFHGIIPVQIVIISNQQNLNAAQGAGIQAAQTIVKAGAGALVTGHCGPKAFRVLAAAGVKVYNTDAPTIAEALARYLAGQLTEAAAANVESHWA